MTQRIKNVTKIAESRFWERFKAAAPMSADMVRGFLSGELSENDFRARISFTIQEAAKDKVADSLGYALRNTGDDDLIERVLLTTAPYWESEYPK